MDTFFKELKSKYESVVDIQRERRAWITVSSSNLTDICSYVKNNGFEHLSTISANDWLQEQKFELSYHLWSYTHNWLLTIQTKIDRDNPIVDSVNGSFGTNAESCEREIHELFGITFQGNKNLTSLFLEDWEGPPPFRKDFNWREYVRENVFDSNNPREQSYYED